MKFNLVLVNCYIVEYEEFVVWYIGCVLLQPYHSSSKNNEL